MSDTCIPPSTFCLLTSSVQMVLIKRRTWKNTEWPDVTLMSPEKPEATKADRLELRQVFDTIVLAETDFEDSVESQAIRFCDVLKRGCRGVPEDVRLMRALYDRARKKFAILDRSSHPTGGYLRSWTRVKKALAKQKMNILDLDDDMRPGLKSELTQPFFIDLKASRVTLRMSLQQLRFESDCSCWQAAGTPAIDMKRKFNDFAKEMSQDIHAKEKAQRQAQQVPGARCQYAGPDTPSEADLAAHVARLQKENNTLVRFPMLPLPFNDLVACTTLTLTLT